VEGWKERKRRGTDGTKMRRKGGRNEQVIKIGGERMQGR
jgi:hypothetical protein